MSLENPRQQHSFLFDLCPANLDIASGRCAEGLTKWREYEMTADGFLSRLTGGIEREI